jgi:hypothetical protein
LFGQVTTDDAIVGIVGMNALDAFEQTCD